MGAMCNAYMEWGRVHNFSDHTIGARVKMNGGGLKPATRMVARSDTAVLETANVPDDTVEITLTADFRRVRITEITVVYEPKVCAPTGGRTKD